MFSHDCQSMDTYSLQASVLPISDTVVLLYKTEFELL